jgi:hypothetical protein
MPPAPTQLRHFSLLGCRASHPLGVAPLDLRRTMTHLPPSSLLLDIV